VNALGQPIHTHMDEVLQRIAQEEMSGRNFQEQMKEFYGMCAGRWEGGESQFHLDILCGIRSNQSTKFDTLKEIQILAEEGASDHIKQFFSIMGRGMQFVDRKHFLKYSLPSVWTGLDTA
jgi:hypothetical protein